MLVVAVAAICLTSLVVPVVAQKRLGQFDRAEWAVGLADLLAPLVGPAVALVVAPASAAASAAALVDHLGAWAHHRQGVVALGLVVLAAQPVAWAG